MDAVEPQLLDVVEAAHLLRLHPKTLKRMALADPSLPCVRLGVRTLRFPRQALEAWLARKLPRVAQRVAQAASPAA